MIIKSFIKFANINENLKIFLKKYKRKTNIQIKIYFKFCLFQFFKF